MQTELVHVWLGIFESEEKLCAYFDEQYQNDNAPLNGFAADQGITYYDHDRVESVFCDTGDLCELMDGASYSKDFLSAALDAATRLGIHSANTFVMAFSQEFDYPKSVRKEAYRLWYLGIFECYP